MGTKIAQHRAFIHVLLTPQPYASRARFVEEIPREPDEYVVMVFLPVSTSMGYTGGGTQVRAAVERSLNSCPVVGRVELDSLQHN